MMSDNVAFCDINKALFRHLRMGAGCQGTQPCVWRIGTFSLTTHPNPRPPGRGEGLEVESVNHDYVMKPPFKKKKKKKKEGLCPESFQVGEYMELWGKLCIWNEHGSSALVPHFLPYAFSHLDVPELFLFIINWSSSK